MNIQDDNLLQKPKVYLPLPIRNHVRALQNMSRMEEARKKRKEEMDLTDKRLDEVKQIVPLY